MSHPEPVCLVVEERLSALLDGELEPAVAAEALEHAFGCPSCRAFFLAAKRLQALAAESGANANPRASVETAPLAPAARRVRPFLRAAALVAIGLGGGWMVARLPAGSAGRTTVTGAASMTEQRFVALASELMAADPKYQRTMLQVLRLVPALETGEGLGSPEDSVYVQSEIEAPRAARGAV